MVGYEALLRIFSSFETSGSKYTADARARAVVLYQQGLSMECAARRVGVPKDSMRYWLKKAGIKCRPNAREFDLTELIHDYQANMPIVALRSKHRMAFTTIKEVLKSAGVPPRGQIRTDLMTDDQKQRAAELYSSGLSIGQVVAEVGGTARTIVDHIERQGVRIRTRSEGTALLINAGQRPTMRRGVNADYISPKADSIQAAHSTYELIRMWQLDCDDSVASWTRKTYIIPLPDGKHYVPDFTITYTDGSVVVEEVKPMSCVSNPDVQFKGDAARAYLAVRGIEFRFYTQQSFMVRDVDTLDFSRVRIEDGSADRLRRALRRIRYELRERAVR